MRGDILPWRETVCPSVDCPGGTLYTSAECSGGHCTLSAKRPGGQILGGTLYTTTPALVRCNDDAWL